jgi:RNA polymerase sigma-70 factor (ECF subfamily)
MMTEVSTIWKDFHRELRAFIQTKTRNSSDTDDILQEAFIKIIRNFDKVSQSANLRHYLYGIVRNTISDHFRNSKSTGGADDVTEPFSPGETQSLNATIAECCIKPFINKLPAHYREALLITEFQQVSQKELAMMLGISYSGAKSRVQRGKEKLKELILSCCLYQSDVYGNLLNTGKKKCSCS